MVAIDRAEQSTMPPFYVVVGLRKVVHGALIHIPKLNRVYWLTPSSSQTTANVLIFKLVQKLEIHQHGLRRCIWSKIDDFVEEPIIGILTLVWKERINTWNDPVIGHTMDCLKLIKQARRCFKGSVHEPVVSIV